MKRKRLLCDRLFREKGDAGEAPAMSKNLKMFSRSLELEAQGAGIWEASFPLVGDDAYGQASCLMLFNQGEYTAMMLSAARLL